MNFQLPPNTEFEKFEIKINSQGQVKKVVTTQPVSKKR